MRRFEALERSHADDVRRNIALAADVRLLSYSKREEIIQNSGKNADIYCEGAEGNDGRRAEDAESHQREDAGREG